MHMLSPTTSGLRKDNRKVKEGQEEKGPPIRPICHASTAPNNVLSPMLVPIIRAVAEEADKRAVASTEEIIANIKKINERERERGGEARRKMRIGSMDSKALYPSLSREWVRRIIFEKMKESKVRVKIENWTELALYIALTHKQEEIDRAGLGEMIHTRKLKRDRDQALPLRERSPYPQKMAKKKNGTNQNDSQTQTQRRRS